MAMEIPSKLYIDKLLKHTRRMSVGVARLSGPVKTTALHTMADRIAADEAAILEANAKDLDALGKTSGSTDAKDRIKVAVARVRLTADHVKEIVDRLHLIADLPDPVGMVTSRQERPDGLQVSKVRVPIGVIGVISERNPMIMVESIALCMKSGNLCIFRGAPEWKWTLQALDGSLRGAVAQDEHLAEAWAFIDREEKEIALDLMRASKGLDAMIVRGGSGLRKTAAEHAKVPVICDDGGLTHFYVDEETDLPMAQNLVINSKVQQMGAVNALDTVLVQQVVGRQFLPPLINRLLDQFKVEVRACPKTVALMGQMAMTGHTAIVPAADDDWQTQFAGPVLAIKMVESLKEALTHIATHGPCQTAAIVTSRYEAAMEFTREVDAGAVLVNASTRLHAGDSFGMGTDAGLGVGRLHAKGPIGLDQLTCEKYVAFGMGQLRLPHPVPDTYFDAIMLKRP